MAVFVLSASPILDGMSYRDSRGELHTIYSVSPFQRVTSETIEARTVEEVTTALERFALQCEAMARPLECSAYFPRQAARKPRGYDDAKASAALSRMVRLDLVTVTESRA